MIGKLNGSASPKIIIELYGVFGKSQAFEAIIDTGFTGSVSMPIVKALPLGLTLFSTATFTLADNSKENTFLCLGTAKIEGQDKAVVISLSKGNDILIGTEFLKTFGAKLYLDYTSDTFTFEVNKPNQLLFPQTPVQPKPITPQV
jgi:predicted aspartyl protease